MSFSCPKVHSTPKLSSYAKKCGLQRVRWHKERHIDGVITVGTLSGFQDFVLQPIIKDRPNMELRNLIQSNFGIGIQCILFPLCLEVSELVIDG